MIEFKNQPKTLNLERNVTAAFYNCWALAYLVSVRGTHVTEKRECNLNSESDLHLLHGSRYRFSNFILSRHDGGVHVKVILILVVGLENNSGNNQIELLLRLSYF